MAWGYSPRPVIKARRARIDTDKAKGLPILLFIISACASLLAFGVITAITDSSESPSPKGVQGQRDDEVRESHPAEPSNAEIQWKTESRTGKKYSDYSSKPKSDQTDMSVWEKFEAEQKAREREERRRRDPSEEDVGED